MSDTNVIRLPTAAKRKVQQPPFRRRRELAEEVDQHPAEFLFPFVRKMLRDREDLQGTAAESMKDSAALLIAVSLLAHADPVLKAKVYGTVSHLHDLYRTAETKKAVWLVEPLLNPFRPPPGAA